MFPVFILEEGVELPKSGTYYVFAKEGLFLHKENDFVEALVKVDKISILRSLEVRAKCKLLKIRGMVLAQALQFFRKVYDLYRSEAILLLFYSYLKKKYELICPDQEVSFGKLKYRRDECLASYQLVGTIHSHGSMTASHSFTDDKDEADFDGIHITLGNVEDVCFSISASIVVNSNRFVVRPESMIEGLKIASNKKLRLTWVLGAKFRNTEVPEEWLSKVKKIEESNAVQYRSPKPTLWEEFIKGDLL